MASSPLDSLSFSEDEAAKLSELDSLEFGFFRIDVGDNKKLLDRAVFYLDGIIARKVYELEEARAKEEQELLKSLGDDPDLFQHSSKIRMEVYLKYSKIQKKSVSPVTYLLLGHYQLLLSRYDDALSAYLKYKGLVNEAGYRNLSFLYGFALCCFHFGAFNTAILLFQQILYLQPSFPRRKEIHVRLGYIYKLRKDLDKSLKHFRQALRDEGPSTWGSTEIQFQIGHLFEVCGRTNQAKSTYEEILANISPESSLNVQHLCLRQLGKEIPWLYQTSAEPSLAQTEHAIQLLQKAIEIDSSNGKTWYLLGRCQAAVNKVQDAFRSYRSSIDKTEASADTWCSIGVLYQEQNQPMDALQAYFCAVQLDKCHVTAWVNLGTLYESMHQFKEALKCYTNAVNADKRDTIRPPVKARIATLQQLLPRLGDKIPVGPTGGLDPSGLVCAAAAAGGIPPSGKLPTVDAAWDLPIPSELTQRQIQLMLQEANRSQCSAFNNSAEHWSALLKNNAIKLEEDEMEGENEKDVEQINKGEETEGEGKQTGMDVTEPSTEAEMIQPPIKRIKIEEGYEDVAKRQKKKKRSSYSPDEDELPTTEEISTLYSLMYLAHGMTAKQRRQYEAIYGKTFNYLLYKKQHPEETLEDPFRGLDPGIFKRQLSTSSNAESSGRKPIASESSAAKEKNSTSDEKADQKLQSEQNQQSQHQQQQNPVDATVADLLSVAANDAGLGADQLPDDDFSLFTDDDIFAQLNGAVDGSSNSSIKLNGTGDDLDIALFQNPPGSANGGIEGGLSSNTAPAASEPDAKSTENDTRLQDPILQMKQETTTTTLTGQNQQQDTTGAPPTMANTPGANTPSEAPQKLSAPVKYVKSLKAILIKPLPQPKWPLQELNSSMSAKQIIDAVSGLGRLNGPWWNSLLPEVDALPSPPNRPNPPCPVDKLLPPTPCICVDKRKDAMSADLAKFCLTQPVVVIRGMTNALRMDLAFFSTKALVDANPNQRVKIHTQSPNTNIAKTRLLDAPNPTEANLIDFSPWYLESPRSLSTIQRYANYQAASFKDAVKDEKQGDNVGSKLPPGGKPVTSPATQRNKIRFATIYDLSNEGKWLSQLWELNRLPSFFKVTSAGNMLAHLGYPLIGVNTIQLNMKIPNARITGHQEGNNMCAVNINVGPGDCEWFAVPEQYWGAIHRLTEHQGLDFLTSSWWPDVEELRQEDIPVYRFLQKPGDLVWFNAGTVFWGQALGWCNNIVWNIGTMTPRQYQLSVERFEYNRLRNVKSAVPMIHLSWQLAKNVRGCEEQLCALIKSTLLRTMVNSQLILDFLEQLQIPVKRHGKKPDDIAHYCQDCEIEVFNILFVTTQEKRSEVRCFSCARRNDPSLQSFSVLSEYYTSELATIYDNFQTNTHPMVAYTVGK